MRTKDIELLLGAGYTVREYKDEDFGAGNVCFEIVGPDVSMKIATTPKTPNETIVKYVVENKKTPATN